MNHLDLKRHLLGILPFLASVLGLFAMYTLIPNRRVEARHAAIGAVLVGLLFEGAKWTFAAYMHDVTTYRQIYGALAAIPVFLIWIYVSWVIVLLGASVTASMSAFDYRPRSDLLPEGAEFLGLMHLLKHFVAAQREGRALGEDDLRACERFVSDDLLQRYLGDLNAAGLVQRTESDQWVMVRSLVTATLVEIYRAGRYRLPLDEDLLGTYCKGLPDPLRQHLDELAQFLRTSLGTQLSALFSLPPSAPRAPRTDADANPESS